MRRGFYLILGFTFPGFWMLHSGSLLAELYLPLQILFHTEATGWPSFITATLLYIGMILLFEFFIRAYDSTHP